MNKLLASHSLALLSSALLFSAGCSEKDSGYACTVANPGEVTVDSQSMECRSRLCLAYNDPKNTMCTDFCDNDDGCPGTGESPLCKRGFVCMAPLASGGLKCCKMCVCRDLVKGDVETVRKEREQDCAGFSPQCPGL